MTTTDTPRTDVCPHCGAPRIERDDILVYWCGTVDKGARFSRSLMCKDTMVLPRLLARAEKAEADKEAAEHNWREGDKLLSSAWERADKAEAKAQELDSLLTYSLKHSEEFREWAEVEVERLRGLLNEAIPTLRKFHYLNLSIHLRQCINNLDSEKK